MNRIVMAAIAGVLAAALVGCVPPQRISVRKDGVMAIPLRGKVYIYDPRNEKLTVAQPAGELAKMEMVRWADWSPDGKRLLIGGDTGSIHNPVVEAQVGDADGTKFKKLLTLTDEAVYFAQWRPDGEAVSFAAFPYNGDPGELREVDVLTGEEQVIMKNASLFHRWFPDKDAKTLATISVDPHATKDLERAVGVLVNVQRDGHALALATIQAAGQPWLDVSPDGKSIIFCAPNEKTPFLLGDKAADFAPPRLQKLTIEPARLQQLTNRDIGYAVYSPDGKHILFVELLAKDKTRIGVMNSDGSRVVNLDEGRTLCPPPSRLAVDFWGAATFQPVWLSNQRVQYYKNPREDFKFDEEMWAVDINGNNKEDLGGKLRKLIDALPGKN